MFEIQVGDMLQWHEWAYHDLSLETEIPEDTYPDLFVQGSIFLRIRVIHVSFGVSVIFQEISASFRIDTDSRIHSVCLHDIERMFYKEKQEDLSDDISFIDTKHMIISLDAILREELLISAF